MRLPEDRRRKLTIGPGLLSESQYGTAIAVAKQMPVLHVEKAFFKVTGERFITPSSLVQLVVKARFIPPGSTDIPPVNALDLEDIDPEEGDLSAILGRKPAAKGKTPKPTDASQQPAPSPPTGASASDPVQPPLAFAPYFARDHAPRWHVFLADSKAGKMAVQPFVFTSFDRPLFEADSGRPTFAVQTLKMQFGAPPQPGRYTFVMHLLCDSYVAMDSKLDVTLVVEDMAKAVALANEEDDISEPEEGEFFFFFFFFSTSLRVVLLLLVLTGLPAVPLDSLAGQMNALKTGGLAGAAPSSKKRVRKPPVVDEDESSDDDDDESDTEGEQEDTSETDTDTDTDGE